MKLHTRFSGRFARWRIGTRLMLGFGLVLALTAALGGMSFFELAHVQSASQALADKWMPGVGQLAASRAAILEVREFEIKHANAADEGYRAEYEEKMGAALAAVSKSIGIYRTLADDAAQKPLLAAFEKNWNEYLVFNRKVVELGRAGKQADARDIGDGAAKMAADDAVAALDRLSAFDFAAGKQVGERARVVYDKAKLGTLCFVAAALLLGLALAAGITRGLLKQMGGEPGLAVDVARAVAAGDLTTPVPVKAGDANSLMAALREMQESLSRVVSTVRSGSQGVANASAGIAGSNGDLSGRTEHQASALQQTAASMQQLGSAVERNADHARQADGLARAASEVASKGGEAVRQVVDTMKGINDSSRKIGEITGVIDGIAFQTNILALNAAVEAARAGEQGRGFAVVAGEVRSLAQRSAEAAKQIKSLIAASVERVEQGGVQADRAGETMQEVVSAIQRVTQIMSEISRASAEQSSGVQQVSEAVSGMDRTIQQNAGLVESSAAAAEGLKQQAQSLVQAVAVFRVAEGARG